MFTFIGFHKVIVGICFFQFVTGQKFTFQSIEFRDDCTTALVSFEVDSKESFHFGWFAVHEDVHTQIGTIFLSSTGRVKFFRNDNEFFSSDDYEFSSSPEYLPLKPSIRNTFISTLKIKNLDVNEPIEFGVGLISAEARVIVSAPFCNVEDQYCQNTPAENKITCGSIFVKQPINNDQEPIPVKCLVNGSLNTSASCFSVINKPLTKLKAAMNLLVKGSVAVFIVVDVALLFEIVWKKRRSIEANIQKRMQVQPKNRKQPYLVVEQNNQNKLPHYVELKTTPQFKSSLSLNSLYVSEMCYEFASPISASLPPIDTAPFGTPLQRQAVDNTVSDLTGPPFKAFEEPAKKKKKL